LHFVFCTKPQSKNQSKPARLWLITRDTSMAPQINSLNEALLVPSGRGEQGRLMMLRIDAGEDSDAV